MNRREADPNIATIIEMLGEMKITQEEHGYVIKRNRDDIEVVSNKLESHIENEEFDLKEFRSRIEPVLELQDDIAAVGRFGKVIKHTVIWLAVVGGAFAAGWEYIEHLFESNT